ncbi:hypothetical protein BDR04DRAFT_1158685 [Suillus decipiens]|nr:hypothetical protein BDR04DRAFT_1158685 [Suillus decipiens]
MTIILEHSEVVKKAVKEKEGSQLGETDVDESSLKVPEKQAEKAKPCGLTEEEKLQTIQYVTDEKHWSEFRVQAGYYWTQISQVIVEGHVSAEQVCNYWHNQALEKYKACYKQDLGFSDEVLDAFEASAIYQLIDSSGPAKKCLKCTESDENTKTSQLLQQAVNGIAEQNQKQAKTEDEHLELARKKDLQEEEERAEKQAIAKLAAEREHQGLRDAMWSQAMEMLKHPDEEIQEEGKFLFHQLKELKKTLD